MTPLIVLATLYIVTVGLSLYVLNRAIFVSKELNTPRVAYFFLSLACLVPLFNMTVIAVLYDELQYTFIKNIGDFIMADVRRDEHLGSLVKKDN